MATKKRKAKAKKKKAKRKVYNAGDTFEFRGLEYTFTPDGLWSLNKKPHGAKRVGLSIPMAVYKASQIGGVDHWEYGFSIGLTPLAAVQMWHRNRLKEARDGIRMMEAAVIHHKGVIKLLERKNFHGRTTK